MGVGAFFFSPVLKLPLIGAFFTLIGCGVFFTLPYTVTTDQSDSASTAHISRWRIVAFGTGAIVLVVAGIGSSPGSGFLPPTPTSVQLALFAGGVMCLVTSAIQWRMIHFDALLMTIIVLSVLLRVIDLGSSVHYFVDEMHFSNGVDHLRGDPYTPLFTPINLIASFPWLYPYLQSFPVTAFGASLGVLRLVSVVFGVLTIPAVYLLARMLFDRPTALIAALVLATFPPHLHFSRLALNNIADPLFGTLALAFFARGIRYGEFGNFVLAGVSLGMTQYFYEGGRMIYPVTLGVWMVLAVVRRESRDWRYPALTVVTALVVIAPLMIALVGWGEPYLPRLGIKAFSGDFWIGSEGTYLADQLLPAFSHLIYHPDGSAFYYGGGTALILPFLLPAFFVGGTIVLRRRESGAMILLLLIIMTVFGNSLIDTADWSARFVVIFPVLAVLVAVGLRGVWVAVAPQARTQRVSFTVAAGLVVILLVGQVLYYFVPHLNTYNQQIRPHRDHQDVLWRARDLPPGTRIYLFSNDFVFLPHFEGMNRFWETDIPVEVVVGGADIAVPGNTPLAFFVNPEEILTIVDLGRAFDLPEPEFSPYNVPLERQYALFYLP